MLKPSDLTKAELLQVVEILAVAAGGYYLDRALGRIETQRNDAHYEKSRKLIDEERNHYAAYFELLKPYEGRPLMDVPMDVVKKAQAEWDKARAAGKEWDRLNGFCGKKRKSDAEADKAERLLVLPCKVGDTLYEVTGRKTISEYRVKAIRVELFCVFIEWEIIEGFVCKSPAGINAGEIGKTVFLTREEAEKALKTKEG